MTRKIDFDRVKAQLLEKYYNPSDKDEPVYAWQMVDQLRVLAQDFLSRDDPRNSDVIYDILRIAKSRFQNGIHDETYQLLEISNLLLPKLHPLRYGIFQDLLTMYQKKYEGEIKRDNVFFVADLMWGACDKLLSPEHPQRESACNRTQSIVSGFLQSVANSNVYNPVSNIKAAMSYSERFRREAHQARASVDKAIDEVQLSPLGAAQEPTQPRLG